MTHIPCFVAGSSAVLPCSEGVVVIPFNRRAASIPARWATTAVEFPVPHWQRDRDHQVIVDCLVFVRAGYLPVMMLVRVGLHTGHAAYALVNRIPVSASR